MTLKSIIQDVLATRGYVYAVVADTSGSIVLELGDPERLQWKGIVKNLFGDSQAIRNLASFLEGQTAPRLHGQGEIHCILLKPREDLVTGLFDQSGRATVDVFSEAQEVMDELRSNLVTAE